VVPAWTLGIVAPRFCPLNGWLGNNPSTHPPVLISETGTSRWQIELFFKALKQNLRIKTFVGANADALQIQIRTTLIAILLLKYLQLRSRFGWSLSNLAALLRQQLFVYRDLGLWIDAPFQPPPLLTTVAQQIPLFPAIHLDSRNANLVPETQQSA